MERSTGRARWLALTIALAGLQVSPVAGVEITGRVVDEDEAPLAGAVVTLHPVVDGAERGALWLDGRAHPEPVARALAGADGVFRIEVPDADPPFWTVVVRARGRVPVEHETGPLFGPVDLPPAVLPESAPAVVRVVGPDGEPAAGVAVLFSSGGPSPRFRFMDAWTPGPFRVARTGPDGRASIPRSAGESGEVVVTSPGRFARAELSGSRVRLELPAAGAPGGRTLRIVGPGGSPVAGAVVWGPVAGVPRSARVSPRMGRLPVAVTGEGGEAVVPALLAPPARALAVADGSDDETPGLYVETSDGLWAEVGSGAPPAEGEPEALVVRLAPAPSARGIVRETGGDPVGHALVWVVGDPAGAVRTSDGGGFALALPPAGRTVVLAAGPGHRNAAHHGIEGTGPPSGIEIFLAPTGVLAGRVEDAGGRGIGGADVEASPDLRSAMDHLMGTCSPSHDRARTGEDGRFQLTGISPGCGYSVTARHDGYAPGSVDVPPPPAGAGPEREPVRLVLSAGHGLTGRVVDDAGVPVPGARVLFEAQRRGDGAMRRELPEAVSGPEGLFALDHLPPSTGRLHVSASGFALQERPGIEVPDAPGVTDLGDVALEPEAFLEVRVEDSSGDALAGAWVSVSTPTPPMSWRDVRRLAARQESTEPRTDASGTFRAGGFRAGDRTRVVVSHPGYAPESLFGVRVPDDSPLTVVLVPGATVSGRVIDDAGRPVPEAGISVEGATSETAYRGPGLGGGVDEEGHFELRDLAPGSLTLRAHGDGNRRSAAVLVEVESGEHRPDVELVLRSWQPKILVRVVTPNGEPVHRAMVLAGDQHSSGSCAGPEEGLYTCRLLSGPGTYTVSARVPGVGAGEIEVEVREADATVDLHLEPEQEVSGRVVAADGEPATGLRVRLHRVEPEMTMGLQATTAADGSFAVRGSLDGEYHLMIDGDARGRGSTSPYLHPETIVVAAGESITGLLIRLESITVVRGRLLGVEPGQAREVRVSARVTAREDWQPFAWGTVLDGGRYELRLTPGTWRIVATEEREGRRGEAEITVAGEAERIVDLDLAPALTVTGVARIDGEPWAGASVDSMTSPVTGAVTDLQGRFELHGLEPGRQELMVRDRDHRPMVRHEIVVGEEREIVVDVRVGRLRGTVLSSVGVEPVADAQVGLAGAEADRLMPVGAMPTTADGRFLIDRVPVGTYLLTVQKAGYQPFQTELRVTGGEMELPPVVLEPETP